jgi:hypothetical protein
LWGCSETRRGRTKKKIGDYLLILRDIEKKVGKGVTTDTTLNRLGRQLLGKSFLGVFSSDFKPRAMRTGRTSSFIINVDGSNLPGSHWLAVAKHPAVNKFIIYDSFARKSKKLIPNFIKTVGYEYVDINRKSDQKIHEDNCGQRSLAFLVFLKKYGVEAARAI